MKIKAHTPGPWNICDMEIISMENDAIIAEVKSGSQSAELLAKAIGAREADSNAKLIAAAPRMLEALIECHSFIKNPYPGEKVANYLEHKVYTAIEKAKGRL